MIGYNEYQNTVPLPRRRAYFVFGGDDDMAEKFVLEGLNVKFDITYNSGALFPVASFGICNLNSAHLAYLTNFFGIANPKHHNRPLQFYAGYYDKNSVLTAPAVPLLYRGKVLLTGITMPPDIWLNIQALASGNIHDQKIQIGLRGDFSVYQIAQEVAGRFGLALDWRATNMSAGLKIIRNFSCDGTGHQFAQKLNDLTRQLVFSSDGVRLRVLDRFPNFANRMVATWKVDASHAMIGEPRFNYIGAQVDTLLNPNIQAGDFVELKSKYQPAGDGIYVIRSLRHHGELRGNDFNTTLDLSRPNGIGANTITYNYTSSTAAQA